MSQLKGAYEAILGTTFKIEMDQFTEKILRTGMAIEVRAEEKCTYAGKDKLYMFNPEWDCSNVV
jgi:hypothetical protein